MNGLAIEPQAAAGAPAATASSQAGLTGQERALLWAPWALLAAGAALSMLLVVKLSLVVVDASSALDQHREVLERSVTEVSPGAEPGWPDHRAGSAALEGAVAQLLLEPPGLLEFIESLAASSGAGLTQFIPEAAAATANASSTAVRLQIHGAPARVEEFLNGLGGSAPALEMTSLRLSPAQAVGELLCELSLRLHGEDSLAELGRAPVAQVGPHGDPPDTLIPGAFFGTITTGMAEGAPPDAPAASVALQGALPDELAGIRLAGILRQGDRTAALLDVPGEGMLLLRPAERLGRTRFRLESAGMARVVLAGDAAERRTLELDPKPVAAP